MLCSFIAKLNNPISRLVLKHKGRFYEVFFTCSGIVSSVINYYFDIIIYIALNFDYDILFFMIEAEFVLIKFTDIISAVDWFIG